MPDEAIVEAHGSFARQSCIECRAAYPDESMREMIATGDVPHCEECGGLVKPEIVFFGEQLPAAFFLNRTKPAEADLCIVMGTSLTVQPFASLPGFCTEGTPRVLINREQAGSLGSRADDVLLLGDCDDGVRDLARACGWLEELEALWAKTAPKTKGDEKQEPEKSKDEAVEDEVDKLTKEVEQTLKLSNSHKSWLEQHLNEEQANGAEKAIDEETEQSAIESNEARLTDPTTGVGVAQKSDAEQQKTDGDGGSRGPDHVYPHIDKKSSL